MNPSSETENRQNEPETLSQDVLARYLEGRAEKSSDFFECLACWQLMPAGRPHDAPRSSVARRLALIIEHELPRFREPEQCYLWLRLTPSPVETSTVRAALARRYLEMTGSTPQGP